MSRPNLFGCRPALALTLAALAAGACDRQAAAPEQASTPASTSGPAPDEVVAAPALPGAPAGVVDRSHRGEPAAAVAFQDAEGKPVTLAAFKGRPLLVNLWATWCAPCVREMPTLDALAADPPGNLRVIAVSQDMDAAKVAPFFAERKLANLTAYRDPALALSLGYAANLPTTFLFDAAGREVWRFTGSTDWSGATARGWIAEAR